MASKPREITYSAQTTGFEPGRRYANARLFTSPRAGMTKVYVVGDWPEIVKAYQAAGVEVVTDTVRASRNTAEPKAEAPAEPPRDSTAGDDLTKHHRGAGRWYVMRGDDVVSGPYSKDTIDEALEREQAAA